MTMKRDFYGMPGEFPPPPWPDNAKPDARLEAKWLLSLTEEQVVAILARQRVIMRQESECFERDHDGALDRYAVQMNLVHADLVAIMTALGIGDHARPYSSHEVIHREVIPAIWKLNPRNPS